MARNFPKDLERIREDRLSIFCFPKIHIRLSSLLFKRMSPDAGLNKILNVFRVFLVVNECPVRHTYL